MSEPVADPSSAGVPYVHLPGGAGLVADEACLGGKGATLCALAAEGFPVPPFFCVTTRVLREMRRAGGGALDEELRALADLPAGAEGAEERVAEAAALARATVLEQGLDPAVREAVEATFARSFDPDVQVAVRSSVVGEDSDDASFAGQMDTFLHVSPEEVSDRVLTCLASAFTERALLYRHARGLLEAPVEAGVVVQEMVRAERSGVAFTADPVSGDPSVVVVSAGLGLGEGIVSEQVETDTFRVAKGDGTVRERAVVPKTRRVVRDEARGGGTRVEEVPEPLREEPALADDELREVVALAARLEDRGGVAVDVEWSVEPGGGLRLLQSRPVTTLAAGRLTILDNSNIVESYPGISSPLTFTFVRHGYAATFREAMRLFGVSKDVLDGEHTLFENLVAYVDGRIYYQILHWYRLYELMALERGIPAWERALGLPEGARPEPRTGRPGPGRRAWIRTKLLLNLFTRRPRIARYLDTLEAEEARLRETDLNARTAHELLDLLDGATERLLTPYGIAVVNDLYAQQLFDLTGRLIERWGLGDPEVLRNALVVGGEASDSVRALRSLTTLADEIRERPEWRAVFEADPDPDDLLDELDREPELAELRKRFRSHLERYGDRTVHELKLETPSLRDDPAFALGLLQGYVLRPGTDRRAGSRQLGREAEARIREGLRFHPLRRFLLSRAVRWTREALQNRENMRLARTRAFGLVKRIFGALARRFVDAGFLDEPDDLFFLTLDEVRGVVRGSSVTGDLRRLVALRREERARHEEVEPPPRIFIRGPVQGAAPSPPAREVPGPRGSAGVDPAPGATGSPAEELRGTGCSRGVARARALVVREPRRRIRVDGRILVAPMTDPGWVFLMVSAGGLVVEKGSPLSHTAIVGRELGIPTVVGLDEATERIRDGDLLEIDGAAGTVRILARAEEDDPAPAEAEAR